MSFTFYKITAAGNDFVLFYNISENLNLKKLAILVSDRHYGVGCDGILILKKIKNEFYLKYLNSDGTEAFCGNGTRSAAFFIYINIFNKKKKNFHINTSAGKLEIRIIGTKIYTQMPNPSFLKKVFVNNKWNFSNIGYVRTGTNHLIIETNDLYGIDVYDIGRFFRYHKIFMPDGTNVNFIKIDSIKNKTAVVYIRTYEKGVENETLSCSSGIASSFYYLKDKYLLNKAVFISKRNEKFYLEIKDGLLYLNGPVKFVFKGKLCN